MLTNVPFHEGIHQLTQGRAQIGTKCYEKSTRVCHFTLPLFRTYADRRTLRETRFVPSLVLSDGTVLTQSLAILEYLEERHPEVSLLPADPVGKAHVRALSNVVACDIQPPTNMRILRKVKGLGASDADWVSRSKQGVSRLDPCCEHWVSLQHQEEPTTIKAQDQLDTRDLPNGHALTCCHSMSRLSP